MKTIARWRKKYLEMTLDEKSGTQNYICIDYKLYKNISYSKNHKMTTEIKNIFVREDGGIVVLRSWVLEPKCRISSSGPLLTYPCDLRP